jgi:exodeoxyribonuclease VII small subunit
MSRRNGVKAPHEAEFAPTEDLSFEAAMDELEAVTARLESGHIALEEMLELTRRGLALADFCDSKLDSAEQVLEQLTASAQGELVAEEVSWDGEDES